MLFTSAIISSRGATPQLGKIKDKLQNNPTKHAKSSVANENLQNTLGNTKKANTNNLNHETAQQKTINHMFHKKNF